MITVNTLKISGTMEFKEQCLYYTLILYAYIIY